MVRFLVYIGMIAVISGIMSYVMLETMPVAIKGVTCNPCSAGAPLPVGNIFLIGLGVFLLGVILHAATPETASRDVIDK